MKTGTEIVAGLINALETAKFELLTLYPRLTGEYQGSVQKAVEIAKVALTDARQFYDSRD